MKKKASIVLFTFGGLVVAALMVFSSRQMLAGRAIESEWHTTPAVVPQLAETSRLEIVPLYEEAGAKGDLVIGHGVSYLIRTDSATILLDTGNNPDQSTVAPFIQNMRTLGIDWAEIDRIVISHPHPDHVGGTKAWWDHTVSMGNLALPDSLGDRLIFVPAPVTFKGAVHATIPALPAPDAATTGVISYPEVFPLSIRQPKGSEQALVVNVAGEGLVVITGCGHPGLEKLVERAETLYGQRVAGVVGGLHYGNSTARDLEPHIRFLQTRQPGLVALSPHDSDAPALAAFESAFGDRYHTLRVGETIRFP